ncbi:MAG TPA: VWA domain-containing protein [Thermoanaerobaculia bacterium]|nr:VWA domain-containing protein [Thermoanaerobaculia bacterium]
MRRPPLITLAFLLVANTTHLSAQAEPPAGGFGETLKVEVVNVDVIATGEDGEPVTDLTRGDFQLFDNGTEVPITNFFAVEEGRRVTEERLTLSSPGGEERLETSTPNVDEPPLHLTVLVDQTHLTPFSRNRLLGPLLELLEERMRQGDRVMVATFDKRLAIRQPFTTSAKDIERAVRALADAPTVGMDQDARYRRIVEEMMVIQDAAVEARFSAPCPPDLGRAADSYAKAVYDDVKASIQGLSALVDSLAGLPGRKALLHVSDGIPLQPGNEVFALLDQICGGKGFAAGITRGGVDGNETAVFDSDALGQGAGSWAKSLALDFTKYDTTSLFRSVAEKASSQRLVIFSLEAMGPRGTSGRNIDTSDRRVAFDSVDFLRVAGLQDSLHLLADETGGKALLNTIDWKPALARVADGFDHYYSLGYRPREGSGGKMREIEVKVRRPGVEVRFQRRHQARSQEEQIVDRTLGTLLLGEEDNPLAVELEIGELTSLDGSLHAVPIRLRIPLAKITLVLQDGAHVGSLRLHLAARDRAGKVAPLRTADIPLKIPAEQLEAARSRSFLYEVKMLMREGDHQVAVGLTDTLGATTSYLLAAVPVVAIARVR